MIKTLLTTRGTWTQQLLGLMVLMISTSVMAQTSTTAVIAERYFTAWQRNAPIPVLSSEEQALAPYTIQQEWVKLRRQKQAIAGFKAGLTSKQAQQKFRVDKALAGVLFQPGQVQPPWQIKRSDYRGLMIETELGFSVNRTITKPVESVDQLKALVAKVYPVIELPDIGFAQMPVSGQDLIASNLGSASFIKGPAFALDQLGVQDGLSDLNAIAVSLTYIQPGQGDQLINQGKASDALSDQWRALLFLINHSLEQGYTISPDHLLITGAIGKMIPAKPGHYRANFGALNTLEFVILP